MGVSGSSMLERIGSGSFNYISEKELTYIKKKDKSGNRSPNANPNRLGVPNTENNLRQRRTNTKDEVQRLPSPSRTSPTDAANAKSKVADSSSESLSLAHKYVAFLLLIFQNIGVVLFSKLHEESVKSGKSSYVSLGSTAADNNLLLTVGESLKATTCFVLLLFFDRAGFATVFDSSQFLKMSVPGILYFFQNRLMMLAISNLPGPVFSVLMSIKTIMVAVFGVVLLGKRLSKQQHVALVLLSIGVTLVQEGDVFSQFVQVFKEIFFGKYDSVANSSDSQKVLMNLSLGGAAALACATMSGLNGIYLEAVLKGNISFKSLPSILRAPTAIFRQFSTLGQKNIAPQQSVREERRKNAAKNNESKSTPNSLIAKNFHMAFISILCGHLSCMYYNAEETALYACDLRTLNESVFRLDFWKIMVVIFYGWGGLLVSFVIKYLDAVRKAMAGAAAIILICFIYRFLEIDSAVDLTSSSFMSGALAVTCGVYLYGIP